MKNQILTLLAILAAAALNTACKHPARHTDHAHVHGPGCGHQAITHAGHVDYLHDGHLHFADGQHYDEHQLAVNQTNPNQCTPDHACGAHANDHKHGPNCGHAAVPHGDHTDYLVNGHLHHPHGDHCDNHGDLQLV